MHDRTEKDTPADVTLGIASELERWRTRALNATLAVVSIAGAPAIGFIIGQAIRTPERWPAASIFAALYLFGIALVVFYGLPLRLRTWGALLLGYVAGALSLARGGLAGDGAMYLMVLPALATILLGVRSGLAAVTFSLLLFAIFALAAHLGWLTNWLVTLNEPLPLIEWAYKGTGLAMLSIGLVVLLWFFSRSQVRVLQDSRGESS